MDGHLTDSASGRDRINKLTFDELSDEICMVQLGYFQPGEKACVSAESGPVQVVASMERQVPSIRGEVRLQNRHQLFQSDSSVP